MVDLVAEAIRLETFLKSQSDLRDARSVVVRQGAQRLDWHYMETHLAGLAELRDDAAPIEALRKLRESRL